MFKSLTRRDRRIFDALFTFGVNTLPATYVGDGDAPLEMICLTITQWSGFNQANSAQKSH